MNRLIDFLISTLATVLHFLEFECLGLEICLSLLFEELNFFVKFADVFHHYLHLIHVSPDRWYLHNHSPSILIRPGDIDPDALAIGNDAVEVSLEELHHLDRSLEMEVWPLGNEDGIYGLAVFLRWREGFNVDGKFVAIRSELEGDAEVIVLPVEEDRGLAHLSKKLMIKSMKLIKDKSIKSCSNKYCLISIIADF